MLPEQAASIAFGWYWINRKQSLTLLCRTMQKSRRSQWRVEVLEVVSASRASARKTALIKKFKSSENEGGLNCLNGRGRVVSQNSRIRHSEAVIGNRNPHTRANPRRVKELSKTLSSRKVGAILGIHKKTVQRHLRGEFGKSKYADQSSKKL
jgi:DNA-binding CsgD family transcriptional regulator